VKRSAIDAARLTALGTATIYEAAGDGALDVQLRPAWPGARLAGRAFPVQTAPGDNLALHIAVQCAEAGDVLVADAGGQRRGHWGGMLTAAASARGIAGLVIDGGVRDTAELADAHFPVFAPGTALAHAEKQDFVSIGMPIVLGGVCIERGDVIVADEDGVVVIPAARFEEVLVNALERGERERERAIALSRGMRTLDISPYLPRLAHLQTAVTTAIT
jgi:4-hydroxy-4-methyl-2-oxoglutarate aldolase